MLIHEYQAKELFRNYGIPVSPGGIAFNVDEAVKVARELNSPMYAVKAQVHAGGRGKAGGIKLVKSVDEVRDSAEKMFGMKLITHQTGPEGKTVRRVYIEKSSDIDKEYYFGIIVDRNAECLVVMCSSEGGVDIEEVAAKTPEKIFKEWADPSIGLQANQARKLAFKLHIPAERIRSFVKIALSSYRLFIEKDCSLLEINPLILTPDSRLRALDAKMNFDNNALHRHTDIARLRDLAEEDPMELRAGGFGLGDISDRKTGDEGTVEIRTKGSGLSYVNLDGNVGCLVNGAGLAMATMDIIKYYGASPANFLDVGGSASKEVVAETFKLILADPRVEGILVNIFGGIMKCDIIAGAMIQAVNEIDIKVPLVVRLEGTNVDIAMKMLEESDLKITTAKTMSEAAEKIVDLISSGKKS